MWRHDSAIEMQRLSIKLERLIIIQLKENYVTTDNQAEKGRSYVIYL